MSGLTRKIVVVAVAIWFLALVAGAISAKVSDYLHRKTLPAGYLEYRNVADLFGAQAYQEAVSDGVRAIHDKHEGKFGPRILFLCWQADQRLNKPEDADAVEKEFLRLYPNDAIGADLRFAAAIQDVDRGNKSDAANELSMVIGHYPQAGIRPFAQALLEQVSGNGNEKRPTGAE